MDEIEKQYFKAWNKLRRKLIKKSTDELYELKRKIHELDETAAASQYESCKGMGLKVITWILMTRQWWRTPRNTWMGIRSMFK